MNQLRVGVIGVGRMGEQHSRIYSGFRKVDFKGIYDFDENAASRISQRYHVPVINSIDELLEQVDAVSVTTPTKPHFDLVSQCINKGVHVLVEKPITETLEQAEELTRMAEGSDLIIQVGHIERYNPTYIELKNVLENMSVLAINFRRLSPFKGSNTDVDVILDLMIHDLDLVLDLIQAVPDHLSASGLSVFSDQLEHVVAQLGFNAHPMVTITASRVTEQKIRAIEVTAREAYIEADLSNKSIAVHRRSSGEYLQQNHGSVKYRQESVMEKILVPMVEPLFLEIEDFINCIYEQRLPQVPARDGLNALRLAVQIRDFVNSHEHIMVR